MAAAVDIVTLWSITTRSLINGFQYLKTRPVSWSSGQSPGFNSRFYHGNFSLQGKIPVVTMVWVVSRFRLKAPPGISSSSISPLTSSGQRSHASWASQPQKSAALSPQSGGKPRKFRRTCGGIGREKKKKIFEDSTTRVMKLDTTIQK